MTSRLDIFREVGDPDEFLMIVELMKHDISYDLEKRKRIFDKYIAVYKPAWTELLDRNIDRVSLKEYIAGNLREPHNIDIFFENTWRIRDIRLLIDKVDESKEILKVFTQDIERSSTAEKVFFYVCYIFGKAEGFEHTENSYLKVLKNFGLDPYRYDFRKLLKKHNFRVETYHEIGLKIRFSHPIFSKAIEESFMENASIIGRILLKLVEDDDYSIRWRVTKTLAENFNRLPEECRRILFKLAKSEEVEIRRVVAWGIQYNFEKLPDEYRRILFELIKDKDDKIMEIAAEIIQQNFEKLPDEYRRILFELAKVRRRYIRKVVAETLCTNFEKLSEEYRRILFELAEHEIFGIPMIHTQSSLHSFRKDVPIRLYEHTFFRGSLAGTLCKNFDKLSKEYRKILFELARNKNFRVRESVVYAVAMNFDKLPENYRKILFELAKDKAAEVRATVALAVGQNFEGLPLEYHGILKEFTSDITVLDSLRNWIKGNEALSSKEETLKILKRELSI